MRRFRELRFLEIGIDPNLGDRANRHQALAGDHVVARVHVPPGNDAIDLGEDLGIAKIQLGIGQVLLGLKQLGLGLLNGRRIFQQLRVNLVDIALRVALVEIRHHLAAVSG